MLDIIISNVVFWTAYIYASKLPETFVQMYIDGHMNYEVE